MSRIKGKYVAQVEIEFDFERTPYMCPLSESREKICGGWFTEQIAHMIEEEIDLGKVNVTQLYADIYEIEEDNDANN